MGQCCASPYSLNGEEFIDNLIHQKGFKLASYDYNRLLNEIASIRTEQLIVKKHLEKRINNKFYDNSIPQGDLKYIQAILDHILTQLKPKNNIYEVVILFYPFIDHSGEKVNEKLYSTFKYMTGGEITINQLEGLLWKYINFASVGLTKALLQVSNLHDLAKAFSFTYSEIFTEDAINDLVKEIIETAQKVAGNCSSSIVPLEAFAAITKKWDLSSVVEIRKLLFKNF